MFTNLSVAPMMDWTDRHYRSFLRFLSRKTLLYTEMVTTGAILHGNQTERFLGYSPAELPLVLQLGGDNPKALAECTKMAHQWGYSAVNLNVGCPSDRVQNGNFGACLMAKPELVRDCVSAMIESSPLPVSVKHRIGIDRKESYEDLCRFVQIVSDSGCQWFIVHARIAILNGLSPKDNRNIPPLRYFDVYQLKQDFPHLKIEINGGITDLKQAQTFLDKVDGVMIGRASYENPYIFSEADAWIDRFSQISYGFEASTSPISPTKFVSQQTLQSLPLSRGEVIEKLIEYCEHWITHNTKPQHILKHSFGLFANVPNGKSYRRFLSENMYIMNDPEKILKGAIREISPEILKTKGLTEESSWKRWNGVFTAYE